MSTAIQHCPRCGAANSISARFCQNCAQPLTAPENQRQSQSQPTVPTNYTISGIQQLSQAPNAVKTKGGCLNRISGTFLVIIVLVVMCGVIARFTDAGSSRNGQTVARPTFTPVQPDVKQAVVSQDASANVAVAPTPVEAAIPAGTGPTYNEICNVNESNVTDIQLKAHADSFAGQNFTNWQGYVYDVQERDGQYIVQLADDTSGLFWARDMEVQGIPADIAIPLRVEQPVLLSGQIAQVDVSFGTLCNPIIIKNATLVPAATGGAALPSFPTGELTYAAVCGVDESKVTEVQRESYARQFGGQMFSNWQGYVYDVEERGGQYILQLADSTRGLVWSRTMEIQGIPADLAVQLNVEQPVMVSGRIVAVEVSFGVLCNPIKIDNATVTLQ